jgi:hypothetical protein
VSGDIEADSWGRGNGETAQCGDFIGSEPLVASDDAGRAVIVSPEELDRRSLVDPFRAVQGRGGPAGDR